MFPPTVRAAAIMNLPGASVPAGTRIGRPGPDRRFDRWAASYEPSCRPGQLAATLWYLAVPACRPEGMAAVRQYRFRVLVTLAPSAREGLAQRLPSRVCALTADACCLVQPACHREYFPAVISWDEQRRRRLPRLR
jgi:hypothetical protein